MREKRKGLARMAYATVYSVKGLTAAFKSEAAVRQELLALIILIPIALYIDVTLTERLLLIFSLILVLITELLNSAIEVLADRVSTETNVLIGKSKDIASAAVFVSILLALATWAAILLA